MNEQERLDALVSAASRRLRRAYALFLTEYRSSEDLAELATLMEQGREDEALQTMERSFKIFANEGDTIVIGAGTAVALELSNTLGQFVEFDQVNERAVAIMQEAKLRMIRQFTDSQRDVLRDVMTDGITRGVNPRVQAREFRDAVGLTQKQRNAVINYRRLLESGSRDALNRALRDRRFDRSVEAAVSGGKPLTPDQIDRMVTRYRDRYIAHRAETIARTEALRAVHQGNEETFAQALENSLFQASDLDREWFTAGDERVRGSHKPMHGQKRPFGEPFVSGNGALLDHPGDPRAPANETIHCRCVVTTTISSL